MKIMSLKDKDINLLVETNEYKKERNENKKSLKAFLYIMVRSLVC